MLVSGVFSGSGVRLNQPLIKLGFAASSDAAFFWRFCHAELSFLYSHSRCL